MTRRSSEPSSSDHLTFAEKIRSINFGQVRHRKPKVTTDVHDHHTVDVTEHWHDRQDVTVRPETLRLSLRKEEA